MIAKIGRSGNLYGALAYNQLKVENENGQILFANKMIETASGHYSVAQLAQSFAPYLIANRNTEKHTLHISLILSCAYLISCLYRPRYLFSQHEA